MAKTNNFRSDIINSMIIENDVLKKFEKRNNFGAYIKHWVGGLFRVRRFNNNTAS